MSFNSIDFFLFIFLFFNLIFRVPKKYQHLLILLFSYYFYAYWKFNYLFLILFSSVVDYSIGLKLGKTYPLKTRKMLLFSSLALNLGLLSVFKYYNFFSMELISFFQNMGVKAHLPTLNLLLPVGISFYTFQTMSYTIDIYQKKIQPEKNFLVFLNFVCFFPQLVAGPIETAKHLIPQLKKPFVFNANNFEKGWFIFFTGLFKKVIIADYLAVYVDKFYNNEGEINSINLLLATYFFSIQILMDFSGYSDMAIGLSKILGIDLMENFRRPYLSQTVGEFWRRWHISLSTWFKNYVYIPLGGRNSLYKNAGIVFVLSGIWHGANWTFLIWGLLNFVFMLTEREFSKKFKFSIPSFLKIFITFNAICLTWIFFRAANLSQAMSILSGIVALNFDQYIGFTSCYSAAEILVVSSGLCYLTIKALHNEFKILDRVKYIIPMRFYFIGESAKLILILIFAQKEKAFLYFQF